MDMSSGVLQVYSMEAVAEQYRGVANSGYQAAFLVPWALMAPIGGVIITHFGYPAVFIGGALSYLLASLILWGKFSRGRKKEFEHVGESDTGGIMAEEKSGISSSEMLHS
jgi:predicted MFS family arabinose efflux permease